MAASISTAEIALVVSGLVACVTAYNTVTARKSLRWQQARDEERRELRVQIHFEHAAVALPTSEGATMLIGGPENLPLYYRLRIVVVNASETSTAWIRSVHAEDARGNKGIDLTDRDSRPHRLKPSEPLVLDLAIDPPGPDFSRVIARAHVAPDQWIESAPEDLMDELVQDIAYHNSRGALGKPLSERPPS